jgi:hypothetical protein
MRDAAQSGEEEIRTDGGKAQERMSEEQKGQVVGEEVFVRVGESRRTILDEGQEGAYCQPTWDDHSPDPHQEMEGAIEQP